jgi:hypothetical protein
MAAVTLGILKATFHRLLQHASSLEIIISGLRGTRWEGLGFLGSRVSLLVAGQD